MSFLGPLCPTLNNRQPPLSSHRPPFLDLWQFTLPSFQLPWLGTCLYWGMMPESGPTVSSERASCLGWCCRAGMDRISLLTNTASLLIPQWHFTFTHNSTVLCARAVPESCFTSVPSPLRRAAALPASTHHLLLPQGTTWRLPRLNYTFVWIGAPHLGTRLSHTRTGKSLGFSLTPWGQRNVGTQV